MGLKQSIILTNALLCSNALRYNYLAKEILMKKLALILLILSTCVYARQNKEFMEFGLDDENSRLKGKKTNFHVKLGGQYSNYVNGNTFNGARDQFAENDEEGMGGLDLTLGYQISIYGPLSITINTNWFHFKKNKEDTKTAENGDVDEIVTSFDRDYKVYGGGFSGALNYEFQANNLVWQPFFELGGGVGKARFEIDYTNEIPSTEFYRGGTRDTFSYLNTGLGINIIAASGIFSYFKASLINYVNIKRSYRGVFDDGGGENPIDKNGTTEEVDDFATTVYSLGMGYTF